MKHLQDKKNVTAKCTFFIMIISMVNCSPPEDPIKCTTNNSNCTITNTYGAFPDRSLCRAARVVYPTTEEELISAVANATKTNTRMKVATRSSHSIPKLVCPEGNNGLLISTKYLNRTLDVNVSSMTMTVESGMTLRQLINDAAKAKLALPYAPYWWGLTIGGMMGTDLEMSFDPRKLLNKVQKKTQGPTPKPPPQPKGKKRPRADTPRSTPLVSGPGQASSSPTLPKESTRRSEGRPSRIQVDPDIGLPEVQDEDSAFMDKETLDEYGECALVARIVDKYEKDVDLHDGAKVLEMLTLKCLSVARGLTLNGLNVASNVRVLEAENKLSHRRVLELESERDSAMFEIRKARDEAKAAKRKATAAEAEVAHAMAELDEAKKNFEKEIAEARAKKSEEELQKARTEAVEEFKNSEEFGSMLGDYGSGSYTYGLRLARAFLRTKLPEDQRPIIEDLKTVADLADDLELSAEEGGEGLAGDEGGEEVETPDNQGNSPIDID